MIDDHCYTVKELTEIGECPRKWAAKRLHHLPDPKHPKAQEGIDMHALLADMLRHGPSANVNPESKVGKWARAVYPLAPAGSHPEVQQSFVVELPGGLSFQSSFAIDWVAPGFTGFGDWKKVGYSKYALDAAALKLDLQANLECYGFAKTMGLPWGSPIPLRWCYVEAEHARAWAVDFAIAPCEAEAFIAERAAPRVRLIRAMRALQPVPAVQAVPHDLTACGGSGRFCAFLGQCQFQPASSGLNVEQLYQLAR